MGQYSDIEQITITSTFLWVLFNITSLMMELQIELVECIGAYLMFSFQRSHLLNNLGRK